MDDKQIAAEAMVRRSALDSLRGALDTAAEGLQRSARRLAQLADSVDDIGRGRPANPRILTADGLLTEALATLGRNAPDLANLALAVEQYNRHVLPVGPEAEPVPECETVTMGAACTHEPLAGLRVCFGHLWQAARSRGVGNVFPVGSPEPKEASVPTGTVLVGENGVQWKRSGWGDWEAGGPAGDGQRYHWSRVNGHNQDGLELALLLPEVVR